MLTTRYFAEQVLRKRPFLSTELCQRVVAAPLRGELQPDGRIRLWREVSLSGEPTPRILRVVPL